MRIICSYVTMDFHFANILPLFSEHTRNDLLRKKMYFNLRRIIRKFPANYDWQTLRVQTRCTIKTNALKSFSDIPVAVSFPHFYGGDPSLVDNVNGIAPDVSKHESEVAVQPVTNPMFYCNARENDDIDHLDGETYTQRNIILKGFSSGRVITPWLLDGGHDHSPSASFSPVEIKYARELFATTLHSRLSVCRGTQHDFYLSLCTTLCVIALSRTVWQSTILCDAWQRLVIKKG